MYLVPIYSNLVSITTFGTVCRLLYVVQYKCRYTYSTSSELLVAHKISCNIFFHSNPDQSCVSQNFDSSADIAAAAATAAAAAAAPPSASVSVSSNSSLRAEALVCLRTTLAEVESSLVSAAWDPDQRLRVVDLAALVWYGMVWNSTVELRSWGKSNFLTFQLVSTYPNFNLRVF